MKNFLVFAPVITFFTLFSIFVAEATDVLLLSEERLVTSFKAEGRRLILSWQPLRYPCKYRVETVSRASGMIIGAPEYHRLLEEAAEGPRYEVSVGATPMYYLNQALEFSGRLIHDHQATRHIHIYTESPQYVPILNHERLSSSAKLISSVLRRLALRSEVC